MIAELRRRSTNWRIFTDSVWVGGLLSVVKVAGAAKVVLMARVFGAGDELDAFLVAFLLPSFFAETVAGSLAAAFVPGLVEARERHGPQAMHRLLQSMSFAALLVLSVGAMLLATAAPLVIHVLASGFQPGKRALAQSLLLVLLPLLPLAGLSVVWRAALNSQERFTAAALAPGTTPLLIIAALVVWGRDATVSLLVWTTLAGITLELITLAAVLRRHQLPLMPRWHGWDAATRGVAMQHLPLIAAAAIGNGSLLVDQSIAAMLGSGSVSALNYGTRLATVLSGIAGGALSTAALPQVSRMISHDDWAGVARMLRTYAKLVAICGIPATLLLIALSQPVVELLFHGGAFTGATAQLVTSVQQLALAQVPFAIFVALLLRILSSMKETPLLLRVAFAGFVFNAVGDYVLMQWLGLRGIALSSSLAQMAAMAYLLHLVHSRMRPFQDAVTPHGNIGTIE